MPCPAQELGAITPLPVVAIVVAQAFLPVPQVDGGFTCATQGSGRTCWVTSCPAQELGAITSSAVDAISVAQAFLPVPQVDSGFACAIQGS